MEENDLPAFIKAKSPMGLRFLMLKTNAKYGITFRYFDIQQSNKGEWVAWFYLPSIKTTIEDFNGTEKE